MYNSVCAVCSGRDDSVCAHQAVGKFELLCLDIFLSSPASRGRDHVEYEYQAASAWTLRSNLILPGHDFSNKSDGIYVHKI